MIDWNNNSEKIFILYLHSCILVYHKSLDRQLLEFWTVELRLSIKIFPKKPLKKPNIVKVIDIFCKKGTFFKLMLILLKFFY